MARLTFHGHAALQVETDSASILIDPWFEGNPACKTSKDEVRADAILVSHGHDDHLGNAIEIAKRDEATIVAPFELAQYCARHGAQVHPMHIGGAHEFEWGRVKLTQAFHGSAIVRDDHIEYTGQPCGFVVTVGGRSLYYAGDTSLFGDMQIIGDLGIDLAVIPIGDNFTMGPEDAAKAVSLLRPRVVVPIHYDTFDVIHQDPNQFASMVGGDTEIRILAPGEGCEI